MLEQLQRSISLSFLSMTLLNYTSLIVLMTTRRLMQPLKIRLYPLAVYHYVAEMVLLVVCLSRLVLGSDRFPCLIYKLFVFACTPGIISPWALNGLRITYVFQTGRVKERYRSSNLLKISSAIRSSTENLNELEGEEKKNNTFDGDRKTGESGLFGGGSNFGETSGTFHGSMFGDEGNIGINHAPRKKTDHLTDFLMKRHIIIRIGNILFKGWAILALIFFQTFVALLFFLLELLLVPEARDLSQGCENSILNLIGYCLYGAVNVLLLFIVVIAQLNMKERFMLKWENRFIWMFVSITLVLLALWSFVPTVEFYFPVVWILYILFTLDSLISGWIPTMMTLKSTYGFQWVEDVGNFDPTKVKSLMMNPISRNYFMDFCQQEFSLENPNLWLDIQYFLNSHANQRAHIAARIADTYLRNGSPMQVNISNILRRDYVSKIDNQTQISDKGFFDELQLTIENNMLDTFSRFVHNDQYHVMLNELDQRNQRLKAFQAI